MNITRNELHIIHDGGYLTKADTCPMCGKRFSRTCAHMWRLPKRGAGHVHYYLYYCSYTCMRKAEKEREEQSEQQRMQSIQQEEETGAENGGSAE